MLAKPSTFSWVVQRFETVSYSVVLALMVLMTDPGHSIFLPFQTEASPADRDSLTRRYHIKTIIDLRSTTELLEQTKKRDDKVRSSALLPQVDSVTAETVKIPGINHQEINLNGGGFSRALLWKLKWSSLTKLLALMAAGYRVGPLMVTYLRLRHGPCLEAKF